MSFRGIVVPRCICEEKLACQNENLINLQSVSFTVKEKRKKRIKKSFAKFNLIVLYCDIKYIDGCRGVDS